MKKNILICFGCAVLLLLSHSAYGAPGLYVSGNLGIALLGDADAAFPGFDRVIAESKENVESWGGVFDAGYGYRIEPDTGHAFNLALGYDPEGSFRVEAEISYQKNDVEDASYSLYQEYELEWGGIVESNDFAIAGNDIVSGDISRLGLMVNGYYDFANVGAFTPFIMAGIGYAEVEYDISSLFIGYQVFEWDADYNQVPVDESGSATVVAYQVGTGAGFAVSETLTLDLAYRYFATEDPDFNDVSLEYGSHNFYVGLRYGL